MSIVKFQHEQPSKKYHRSGFPLLYDDVLAILHNIDVNGYVKNRNYVNGSITRLSPYISRGFLTLPQVLEVVLQKSSFHHAEKMIQQLAWREYFQRVWQHLQKNILTDIKRPQQQVNHHLIPQAIVEASTGIQAIDQAIHNLLETGYMHNHVRMYTAMLTCNIAKSHWALPAKWMYYHLLDGDIASNTLSWQWVAGSFSNKKYYANQENINRYTNTQQQGTFLDIEYEVFEHLPVPASLEATVRLRFETPLEKYHYQNIVFEPNQPVFLYNSYQLNPLWHQGENGTRILLLEPNHFQAHSVSASVLEFIVELALQNIPNIQIFTGNFSELLQQLPANTKLYYMEHPTCMHYQGIQESRSWLFPQVDGYYNGFFPYWNKCIRGLKK